MTDGPGRVRPTPLKRFGGAIVASMLIVALPHLARPWLGEPVPTLTFIVPVVLAAWYGGLGPGLLTTGIGSLVTLVMFIPPTGVAQIADRADVVRFIALLLAGCLVSLLSQSLHGAVAAARRSEAESRSLALELERQAARAEAENAAKGHFLTVMSHELRTPLNSITGYAELIALGVNGPVTEPQQESLRRIRLSAAHLLGLINDILNFAKIEAGQITLQLRPLSMAEQLGELHQLIQPQLDAKRIHYDYVPCPPDITVVADAEKVRQILLNVLSNAIKFTDCDGRITLECTADDDVVRVAVRDTGIGIPTDQLESVFVPFVQVRDTAAPREGTGLGLAISRDLARALGGDLSAESTLGQGSVFTLTMPRQA